MPVHKMKVLLDSSGIKYQTITHSESFTAAETARLAHVPPQDLAKVVMVKMVSSHNLDKSAAAIRPIGAMPRRERKGERMRTACGVLRSRMRCALLQAWSSN